MPKSASKALITPATMGNVSFDTQMTTVQSALEQRHKAEEETKKHRIICVDILHKHGIDLRGKPLQPEQLEEVVTQITIHQPRIKPTPQVKEFAEACGYELKNFWRNTQTRELLSKVANARTIKLLDEAYEYGKNEGTFPPVDEAATKKARAEFTAHFNSFRSSLEKYEASKATIDNIKEYIGIARDIATIGETKKGK